jgi:hypothetical protein
MRTRLAPLLVLLALALLPGRALAQAQSLYELASALGGSTAPIAISTAATTQLIPAPATLSPGGGTAAIYVMGHEVVAGGTGNIQFVYGTGSNCGTNQQPITGVYALVAQSRIHGGGGFGPEWPIPPGNAVCAITSAAVAMSGFLTFRVK